MPSFNEDSVEIFFFFLESCSSLKIARRIMGNYGEKCKTGVSESHFKMGGNTRSQPHKTKDNGADDSGRTKEKGKSFEKRDLSTIQCFKCREMEHNAKFCTNVANKASAFKNVSKKLGPEGLSNDLKN